MPKQNPPDQTIEQEAGLPPNWQPINTAPIIPANTRAGAPPSYNARDNFQSTQLPSFLGLSPDLVQAGTPVPGIAETRLIPVGAAGVSQNVAATQSVVQQIAAAGGLVTLTMPKEYKVQQGKNIVVTWKPELASTALMGPIAIPVYAVPVVNNITSTTQTWTPGNPTMTLTVHPAGSPLNVGDVGFIVVYMQTSSGSADISSVTDNNGNAWHPLGVVQQPFVGFPDNFFRVFYAKMGVAVPIAGTLTITVNLSGFATINNIPAPNFMNVTNISATPTNVLQATGPGANPVTGSVTFSDSEYLLSFLIDFPGGGPITPPSGWTDTGVASLNRSPVAWGAAALAAVAGTYTDQWTATAGQGWATTLASFPIDVTSTLNSSGIPAFRLIQFSDIQGQIAYPQLPNSGVTPGSYTNADITVNAEGIVTAASSGGASGLIAVNGTPIAGSKANFNNTTPAAAAGSQNVIFQDDTSTPTTNISAYLPTPTASLLGGVRSAAAVSHEWINSISTAGIPILSQPAFSDISGAATPPQLNGTLYLFPGARQGSNPMVPSAMGTGSNVVAETWTDTFVSPSLPDFQGYTTDGIFHYTFGTAQITKYNSAWSIVAQNTTPFSGTTGISHLGDGCYWDGKLYVPGEVFGGCGSVTGQSIVIYDATTLAFISQTNVSAHTSEVSSICVAPELGANGYLFIGNFCDNTQLYIFDLSTFAFIGTIAYRSALTDQPVALNQIQGVTYRNGIFYIVTGDTFAINQVLLDGTVVGTIYSHSSTEAEGIDFSQDQIRWMYNNSGTFNVHYITQTPGSTLAHFTPGGTLHLTNGDITNGVFIADAFTSVDPLSSAGYIARRARGSYASPSQTLAGDILGGFYGKAWTSSAAWTGNIGVFTIGAAENQTATANGSFVNVANTPLGSTLRAPMAFFGPNGGTALGTTYAATANALATPPPANGLIVQGSVGIGTQSPSALLHLVSPSTTGTQFLFENDDTGGKIWQLFSTGSANLTGAGNLLIRDATDNIYVMALMQSGKVGVNNTNPTSQLQVTTSSASIIPFIIQGASSQTASFFEVQDNSNVDLLSLDVNGTAGNALHNYNGDNANGVFIADAYAVAGTSAAGFVGRRAEGTLASPTGLLAGDAITGLYGKGFTSSSVFSGNVAAIRLLANETYTSSAQGSIIDFAVTVNGTVGRTVRMTLQNDGGLLIGSPTGGSQGAGTINVASGIFLNGSAYTNPDYVFEQAYTGKIEKFLDNPGAKEYTPMALEDTESYAKEHLALPRVHERRELFSRADILLEKVEELYLHIFDLNKRIKDLEAARDQIR